MHDPHDAIRRLYGEPGASAPEGTSPEEQAEFRAMADLKAALDHLPPRSPDASLVNAVVAAAGEAARSAALGPVRAVYGEEVELHTDAARTEARTLAEVKAGLDALPPQRPEASLIDAVVASAGEASRAAALAPIRAVYDEDAEPLTTEAAEAEAAALAPVKAALDALPPRRPDSSVLDAVVAAAVAPPSARPATVAATTGRAGDRAARGSETRRRVTAVLGAVFAVVLVFAGGLWISQDAPTSQEVAVADRAEPEAEVAEGPMAEAPTAEEAAPATPPGADFDAPFADRAAAEEGLVAATSPPPAARSAASAAPEREEALDLLEADAAVAPQAFAARAAGASADDVRLANAEALARDGDTDDELRLLYLRLHEMQAAQAGLGWDTPPVALGAAPDSTPPVPASGWMQVRVQR